jgi:NADH-quinone oxidoreductase subunit G
MIDSEKQPEIKRVEITVNGKTIQARTDKPLIHACLQAESEVPHYCYHPGLTPVGSCRICQVEVQQGKMPARVMVACRTPVAAGMVVDTESKGAHDSRKECLEFLLKNHPLDCPICDKAGECTLQDYSFAEGQGEGRSIEPRRKLEKRKDLGDVIMLDQERCILCSRCVRFMEEVPETPQLCVAGRGSHSIIETWNNQPLSGNYQGNLADVCPVGALTLKSFRFKARVWNLTKTASSCGECSRGCSTTVEVLRAGEIVRIRPRHDEEVNKWWMCDTGRFALDHFAEVDRLVGACMPSATRGWDQSPVEDGLQVAADMLMAAEKPLIVASPWLTVEEGTELLTLGRQLNGRVAFVSPAQNELADDLLHTGDPAPNRRGLTDLGFEALSPEEILSAASEHSSILCIGERVASLLGEDGFNSLPSATRVLLFDCALPAPQEGGNSPIDLAIGLATSAERAGHWVNIDGIRRPILQARPAPTGVWNTVRLLQNLLGLLATREIQS